jgi:AcrR family transcriptional regulator
LSAAVNSHKEHREKTPAFCFYNAGFPAIGIIPEYSNLYNISQKNSFCSHANISLDITKKSKYPNNRLTSQFTGNYKFTGGIMSPRPDVSEERKDQILDAASEVFADKGVHETRMDDIVEKSGLSKGTLYWYFKSKDEIVLNIFERIFAREFEELENMVDSNESATERLMQFADRTSEDVKRMLRLMPLAYEFMGWAFRKKFVQEAFKLYINKFMDILVPVIQQGVDTGEFRDIDPKATAITLGAIFEGTILLWVYDNNLIDVEKHIKEGVVLLLEGMKA